MENTPDIANLSDRIASLSDALARHRLEFQAAESALVTRIADVDDDRRLTTNRLQRAWQTHHEEIDARLNHQASVFIGALLLVAALLGGALFFVYGHLDAAQRTLLEDVARLRVDDERLAAVAAQDAALRAGLADLRASVAAMSESLLPRGEATKPQAPTEESASADQGLEGPSPEPTDESESTDDTIAVTAEEIPSAPAATESTPIAHAAPDAEASPSAAAIRDETAPAPTQTPEDLAGQDAESVAEPSPEPSPESDPASEATPSASPIGDSSPPDEDAPLQTSEPVARSHDANSEQVRPVSARILDEPLSVGKTPFALQLIGFYSLDELLDFARREELPSRVYFREESYQDRPWFVLIHSLHAGYSDASDAIDKLPTQLAILDTWIRNFPPETRLGILHIER